MFKLKEHVTDQVSEQKFKSCLKIFNSIKELKDAFELLTNTKNGGIESNHNELNMGKIEMDNNSRISIDSPYSNHIYSIGVKKNQQNSYGMKKTIQARKTIVLLYYIWQ